MAADKVVRIIVSASADASAKSAFKPIEVGAQKAANVVSHEMARSGAAVAAEAKKRVQAGLKADAELAKSMQKLSALAEAESARRAKSVGKEFDDRLRTAQKAATEEARYNKQLTAEVERDESRRTAIVKREQDKRNRAQAKSNREAVQRTRDIGASTLNTVGRVARLGLGVAQGVAGGLGYDTSIQSLVSKGASLRTTAIGVANQAALGDNRTTTKADVDSVEAAIKAGGDKSGTDYNKSGEALANFYGRSSDLETGKKILGDLGNIAKASGANVSELATAAGDINRNLAETPDKAQKLLTIVRSIAKATADGTIEMKDFAQYMPRISGQAFEYTGHDKLTGHDVSKEEATSQLVSLAQLSTMGGRSTAAEATNSAASFARDLAKSNSQKAFKKYDIQTFTDDTHTQARTPEAIIMDVLRKTGGDQIKIAELFKNVTSKGGVLGAANVYKEAGGGAAGEAAVHEKFSPKGVSEEQIAAMAKLAQESPEGKAEKFNNAMTNAAEVLTTRLAPAFERLAPSLERAASGLADMAGYAVENPIKAFGIALAASVAKAGIETVLKSGITKLLESSGNAGSLISVGVATFVVTTAILKEMFDAQDKQKGNSVAQGVQDSAAVANARVAETPDQRALAIAALEKNIVATEAAVKGGTAYNNEDKGNHNLFTGTNTGSAALHYVNSDWGESLDSQSKRKADGGDIAQRATDLLKMQTELARLKGPLDTMNGKLGGVLNVNIVGGMPGTGAPGVDGSGRTGK